MLQFCLEKKSEILAWKRQNRKDNRQLSVCLLVQRHCPLTLIPIFTSTTDPRFDESKVVEAVAKHEWGFGARAALAV
jgi:hypothetical protein